MTDKREKKERDAGFELLRIVSMVMIVLMHIIGHGGLKDSVSGDMPLYHVYWFIYALSRVSTNCFVMLSGYYMVTSKMRMSRIFRIWFEVFFYSVLTYLAAVKVGCISVNVSGMIEALTPILSEVYWFATAYVLMYLCVPLLNRVITGIQTKKEFRRILLAMLLLTSVLPTVMYWSDSFMIQGGYSYVWFIVLYFIGAYIRLHVDEVNKRWCVLVYVGLAFTVPMTRIAATWLQNRLGATTLVDHMMDYKMPVTVVMSIAFFLLFRNLTIRTQWIRRAILAVAPLSFGVYLLHDSEFLRTYLWDRIGIRQYSGEWISLVYMLVVVVVVMVVGYIVSFFYHTLYRLCGGPKLEKVIAGRSKKEVLHE